MAVRRKLASSTRLVQGSLTPNLSEGSLEFDGTHAYLTSASSRLRLDRQAERSSVVSITPASLHDKLLRIVPDMQLTLTTGTYFVTLQLPVITVYGTIYYPYEIPTPYHFSLVYAAITLEDGPHFTISGVSYAYNNVTYTTTANHGFSIGDLISLYQDELPDPPGPNLIQSRMARVIGVDALNTFRIKDSVARGATEVWKVPVCPGSFQMSSSVNDSGWVDRTSQVTNFTCMSKITVTGTQTVYGRWGIQTLSTPLAYTSDISGEHNLRTDQSVRSISAIPVY
jgi:hypothetical protein